MSRKKKSKCLWKVILPIIYLLFVSTTCEPWAQNTFFNNCTKDSLFVGASHCNNMDSMDYILSPRYIYSAGGLDSVEFSLLKGSNPSFCFDERDIIFPDSICFIDIDYLFDNDKIDTCYFFLIKWSDAKKYSWDEIRDKKMYHTWIVARNKNGEYDTNIRYSESADY